MINIGTKTPLGTVVAVRSGSPRDYLLDDNGTTTWLDELALKELLAPTKEES